MKKIEVLGFAGCPNFLPATERVRAALRNIGIEAEIEEINIENGEAAKKAAFLGSPTIRVNGLDVEPTARKSNQVGWGCRTYVVNGIRHGVPPQEWIEAAIRQES